ncbi:MAG TPA: hypothetical protein VJ032_00810, partial [Thermoanaerobaculia bacterium]|nr:hypothetical protein [Thermoanaerobaculia bacterium]
EATSLYVSEFNGIFLDEPAQYDDIGQFGDLELSTQPQAVIAPLLTTQESQFGQVPAIYVKETADSITVTWSTTGTRLTYDVQARLSKSGDIRFSYQTGSVISGAVVVTSGHESFHDERSTIGEIGDYIDDVSTRVPASAKSMLDIEKFTASRLADTDVIEVRLKMHGAIDPKLIGGAGDYASFSATFGSTVSTLYLYGDGRFEYYSGAWGGGFGSPAAHIEGDTIVMSALQGLVAPWVGKITTRATTFLSSGGITADSVQFLIDADKPRKELHTDFSTPSQSVDGPLFEAFTLPIVSTSRTWRAVRDLYHLQDANYDAIAIYQNFYTDLIFYAGAYSSGGNSQVTGITSSTNVSPTFPRTPALMHMNKVGYGWNRAADLAGHVVMHELGHRWLYFISIMESGEKKFSLNPLRAHPAQYVDTRAAFSVRTDHDASVMGGGLFAQAGNKFTSTEFTNFGYSWLDLYLMGLADKSEVAPWFYIANSNPKLGDAYYPPEKKTFDGERRDVVIQQVIDSMGTRKPAYPDTQRTFRTLFVLLADPSRPATDEEIAAVDSYRQILRENFPIATGGRANVVTDFDPSPQPRRRTVGR